MIANDELGVRRLRPADRPFVEAVGQGLRSSWTSSGRAHGGGMVRPRLDPEPAALRWIDALDGPQHVAYGVRDAQGRPIAMARYVLDLDHPEEAEIAFAVVDGWQGRGAGRIALAALREHARTADVGAHTR